MTAVRRERSTGQPARFTRRRFLAGCGALAATAFLPSPPEGPRPPEKLPLKLPFHPGLHFLSVGDKPDHIEQVLGGRDALGRFELIKRMGHIPIIADVTNGDDHPSQLKKPGFLGPRSSAR